MTQYYIYDAKTNFSNIAKLLEDKKEEMIIISRNGKPLLEACLYDDNKRKIFSLVQR